MPQVSFGFIKHFFIPFPFSLTIARKVPIFPEDFEVLNRRKTRNCL